MPKSVIFLVLICAALWVVSPAAGVYLNEFKFERELKSTFIDKSVRDATYAQNRTKLLVTEYEIPLDAVQDIFYSYDEEQKVMTVSYEYTVTLDFRVTQREQIFNKVLTIQYDK